MTRRLFVAALCLLFMAGSRYGLHAQQDQTVYDDEVQLVSFADLDYPPGPRAARIQGLVVIAATLDDGGNVASASAISGPRALIGDAIANTKKWKFKPNRQKRIVIVYDFQIGDGVCHDRARSLFLLKRSNFAIVKSCENVIEG